MSRQSLPTDFFMEYNSLDGRVSTLERVIRMVGGTPGPMGPIGPAGPPGSNGATGPAAWTAPLSAWSSTVAYGTGPPASVVTRSGGTYVAVAASTNVDPVTDGGANWAQVAAPGTGSTLGAWTAPASFGPSVASKGSPYNTSVQASLENIGVVHLRGVLAISAAVTFGATLATWGSTWRPTATKAFSAISVASGGTVASCLLTMNAAGVLVYANGTSLANGAIIPLDGITYDTSALS